MKFPEFSKYEFSALLIIATAFTYTVLRAYYLPITHDEAASSLYLASRSFSSILLNNGPFTVNNHLLNTLLIKILIGAFGVSEFVVRIPALIGHVLYLLGVYKTLKLFLKNNLLLCGLTILIFNPFLLELFACARGYALGLGFSSVGIYLLLRCVKDQLDSKKYLYVSWSFIMFAFATMANFSFFHIYLLAFLWMVGFEIKNKQLRWQSGLSIFPSVLFLICTCIIPVVAIYLSHEIKIEHTDLMGKDGFWENTVLSLIQATLYNKTYSLPWVIHVIQFFIIGVIIIAGCLVAISLYSKRPLWQDPTFALLRCVSAWLMIYGLMIIFEGGVVKFGYASGRTASFFIPLFYLLFLLVVQCLILIEGQFRRVRTVGHYLVVLFTFISFTHFYNCANFEDFYLANYCKSTRDVIRYLVQLHKGERLKDASVSIGTHRIFTPMLNFYITKYGVHWLKFLPYRENLRGDFDYYYLCAKNSRFLEKPEMVKDLLIVGQHYSSSHLKVIKIFPESGSYLAIPQK